MSFSLPELPYAHDALAPYMSRETLEYHHDKHHLAYVNNGNNLAKGTEWENKPVEEVVKGTYGKNQGLFNKVCLARATSFILPPLCKTLKRLRTGPSGSHQPVGTHSLPDIAHK